MLISPTSDALSPLTVTLRALSSRQGLADPLEVVDRRGWIPAADLVNGSRLDDLFATAIERWNAQPHAAATLAWKAYTYWLALPAVLLWASSRRVPLMDPEHVLVHFGTHSPLLQVGLANASLAVLPDDPLAQFSSHPPPPQPTTPTRQPGITVVADETILLKTLRVSLLDRHLDPLAERIQGKVKVGRHNLRGSIASGIAYGVIRAARALPAPSTETINTLLGALDLHDLIELVPSRSGEPSVQRKTCCLAFTLPEPKICSGCCLRRC